jgi:hypothetical protein
MLQTVHYHPGSTARQPGVMENKFPEIQSLLRQTLILSTGREPLEVSWGNLLVLGTQFFERKKPTCKLLRLEQETGFMAGWFGETDGGSIVFRGWGQFLECKN